MKKLLRPLARLSSGLLGAALAAGLSMAGLIGPLALPALAQDAAESPAESRAESFQAAEEGAQTENVPGGALMVVAYGAVFLALLAYLVSLGVRQTRTQRELERLRRDLASSASDGEASPRADES